MAKFTKQSVHEANLISIAIAIFILNAISNLESTVDCLTSTTKITNKNIKITMEKKGNRERRINKQWTKQRLLCCCWTWWYRRRRWRPRQRTSNNPISIILIPIQNGNWNNNNDDDDCNTTDLIDLQDVCSKQVRPFRFADELYNTEGGGDGDKKTSDNPISNKSIPLPTTIKIDFRFWYILIQVQQQQQQQQQPKRVFVLPKRKKTGQLCRYQHQGRNGSGLPATATTKKTNRILEQQQQWWL